MELNLKRQWPYILTIVWLFTLVVLGGWWLYLVFKFGSVLEAHNITPPIEAERLYTMIKWEGLTFFSLLFFVGISLVYFNLQDRKKNNAMAVFFASLTHELKTPLASIRLQSEFLQDLLEQEELNKDQANKLTARLVQDVNQLESSLDKSLQLARLQKKARLSVTLMPVAAILKKLADKYREQISINIDGELESKAMAEELAIIMIFKNLIENTIRHQAHSKQININIKKENESLCMHYDDDGGPFQGELKALGKLFYKHKSPKGTGIGLYVAKELTRALGGEFLIHASPNLKFTVKLRTGEKW